MFRPYKSRGELKRVGGSAYLFSREVDVLAGCLRVEPILRLVKLFPERIERLLALSKLSLVVAFVRRVQRSPFRFE